MKKDLELENLEDRRLGLRLILMYKVVEGLVPSLAPSEFIRHQRPTRQIKTKQFKDHIATNLVEKRVCNNTRSLVIPASKTPQYKHSFFVDTTIHWNHLPDGVVHARSDEEFKTALRNHRQ